MLICNNFHGISVIIGDGGGMDTARCGGAWARCRGTARRAPTMDDPNFSGKWILFI